MGAEQLLEWFSGERWKVLGMKHSGQRKWIVGDKMDEWKSQ